MQEKVYSITELTREIKQILEGSFPRIWVEGEISNYVRHSSGHRYFTLKDQSAQLRAVIWRWTGQRLHFEPQDGMKVKALGQVTVYEKSGQYQLVVTAIMPAGIGELELAFQQLKAKLAEEGLFDSDHKIPIPEFPQAIGIITSPTGAAIRDILNITRRRAPWIEIILWPVAVQGEGAAEQIAKAIRGFNEHGLVDLLIIGRGGGSLEDLWAFNEEVVARAVFDSELPVISAVGHEIDFAISDFVADLRAPTPSAAAEIAVPDGEALLSQIRAAEASMASALMQVLEYGRSRVNEIQSRYGLRRPVEIIAQRAQRRDDVAHLLDLNMSHRITEFSEKFKHLDEKLLAVSPTAVMKRGYSYLRDKKGDPVTSFRKVAVNDKIDVTLYEGGLETRVTRVDPDGLIGKKKD
jgi:exodeoxyribonuclease VII large subunit